MLCAILLLCENTHRRRRKQKERQNYKRWMIYKSGFVVVFDMWIWFFWLNRSQFFFFFLFDLFLLLRLNYPLIVLSDSNFNSLHFPIYIFFICSYSFIPMRQRACVCVYICVCSSFFFLLLVTDTEKGVNYKCLTATFVTAYMQRIVSDLYTFRSSKYVIVAVYFGKCTGHHSNMQNKYMAVFYSLIFS